MLFGYMDVNKLLQLVAMRRPLWYKKGGLDREEVRRLWGEVGAAMNTSGYIARLKWQNLRDTFRKEVTKLKKSREMGTPHTPTWKHFHQMGFVLELVDPESWQEWKKSNPVMFALSRGNSNPAPSTSTEANDGQDGENLMTISTIISLQDDDASQNYPIAGESDGAVKVEEELEDSQDPVDPLDSLAMDENFTTDTGEDEDYHFLMSLLPHLKEIPKTRKLHVRQKLQQVIINEMSTGTGD